MITATLVLVLLSDSAIAQPDKTPHWSFAPVRRPEPPAVKAATRNALDRFILAALEAKQLALNPEADRLTLIRRVSFDLTGLPPSLAQIDEFVADKSEQAYERMVERFLASPHYGERWGKYWLDVVGYADSNGYFNADSDRPLAWRYRDYVLRSFAADKPYDRFVLEQLAGDELAGCKPGGDITPGMVDLLTATHFLRNAPDGTGESDGNPDEVRIDRYTVLEGTLQIAMNSLLGVTIQCARCHKHKFEPISHAEYYSLQAIFFPGYNPDRWTTPKNRVVQIGTRAERDGWKRRNEDVDRATKALEKELTAAAQPLRQSFIKERLQSLEASLRDRVLTATNVPADKQTPEQKTLLKTHMKLVQVSDDELAKKFKAYADQREEVRKKSAEQNKQRPAPLQEISVFVDTDPKPPVHHVLRRGQHNQPGAEVQPGVLAAVASAKNVYQVEPRPEGSSGRRLALARWITSPDNSLFARVMVNRIWQQHFGAGIVATPDNLGQSGARPSHPELLDYLASEFQRQGWSVKAVHRLILNSATYRQTSTPRDDLAKAGPDNRLLGRFPLRRLDAEALRDAMLSVAGELDLKAGGPYVATKRTGEGVVEVPENQEGSRRRSVYLQQRRTQVLTFLNLFDAPTIGGSCSVRPTSTVPLQALALLNSDFARARARGFAKRILQDEKLPIEQRLNLAFRLACARPPVADEMRAAQNFLAAQEKNYAGQPGSSHRAWTDLCQMLLSSNGFLYVE